MAADALGLYVHVPFCSSICNYCNFNRGLFDADLKAHYVTALRQEIRAAGDGAWADTLFFGGGTPSLLDPQDIADIIEECRGAFALASHAEVTLEANPETVTTERLAAFRDAGVTRVSFGVQSFRDDELQRLNRLHSSSTARAAVDAARQAGCDNVSLDLMMWLPGQSASHWLESVDALIGLEPDHASLYILELYPQAPLNDVMRAASLRLPSDDEAADMYMAAMARLDAAGFEQYEISNVMRPGRACRHNMKYWTDGEWLGFGCGAHSTRGSVRWRNRSSTQEYIDAVTRGGQLQAERRVLTPEVQFEEAVFTGLRLAAGLDVQVVNARYGRNLWAEYGDELARFQDAGLLNYDGRLLRLTRPGMLLANEIMSVFVGSSVVD